jgi:ribonucleoside-diphosphate reductase alpha chain
MGKIENLIDPILTSNAISVLEKRYLDKDASGNVTQTPKELFWKVANVVASVEKNEQEQQDWALTYYNLMANGIFFPNSPALMNPGGQQSACFTLAVEDSIESIFKTLKDSALLFQSGGGVGINFSSIRPEGYQVGKNAGVASGLISFMKIYDTMAENIKQGGKRRGGFMGMLNIDHPDILKFIKAKDDLSQLTNFNLSVGITKQFQDEYIVNPDADHFVTFNGVDSRLIDPDTGKVVTRRELFDRLSKCAWLTGEPALAFIDRAEAANTVSHIGKITTYNLCGEQPLICNSSCVLGSINVSKMVKDSKFNYELFLTTIHASVRFLDAIIDTNIFPLDKIREMTLGNRNIGLGVMGVASALFKLNIPYNSDKGIKCVSDIMATLQCDALIYSNRLADEKDRFPNWKGSSWDEKGLLMRNAAVTTIAPCGSISYFANCSSGIEPLFAIAFQRNVMEGTIMREVSAEFLDALKERNLELTENQWNSLYNADGFIASIQDAEFLPDELKEVFVCAHDVEPEWHLKMQEACQEHCCSGISKTINFKHDATLEDIKEVYVHVLTDSNVKGVTVYRDGCRANQPMSTKSVEEKEVKPEVKTKENKLVLTSVPDMIPAVKLTQSTPFGKLHISLGVLPGNNREIEVFCQLGRSGDVINADLEVICRLASRLLRYGDSLEGIISQIKGIGSSLMVPTADGSISSLPDGIAVALNRYLTMKKSKGLKNMIVDTSTDESTINTNSEEQVLDENILKIRCPSCDSVLNRIEGCIKCEACGYSVC